MIAPALSSLTLTCTRKFRYGRTIDIAYSRAVGSSSAGHGTGGGCAGPDAVPERTGLCHRPRPGRYGCRAEPMKEPFRPPYPPTNATNCSAALDEACPTTIATSHRAWLRWQIIAAQAAHYAGRNGVLFEVADRRPVKPALRRARYQGSRTFVSRQEKFLAPFPSVRGTHESGSGPHRPQFGAAPSVVAPSDCHRNREGAWPRAIRVGDTGPGHRAG